MVGAENLVVVCKAVELLLHEVGWLMLHISTKLLLLYPTAELLLLLLLLKNIILLVVICLAAVASHVPFCLLLLDQNVCANLPDRAWQHIPVDCPYRCRS